MSHIDLRDHEDGDIDSVRELISREAERPLYARAAAGNAASLALLTQLGFIEISGGSGPAAGHGEVVFALPPTLE